MAVDLKAAAQNLQQQVNSGGITAEQADNELRRLALENSDKKTRKEYEKLGIDDLFKKVGLTRTTATKTNELSPSGNAFLADTQQQLQAQVQAGTINQAQADQELQRRRAEIAQLSPELQDARWHLQEQVNSGGINLAQADNELYRLKGLEGQTQPTTNTNLGPASSGADVINTVTETARDATPAGNLLTNPNFNNPFGSQNVSIDPLTGQPIVNQSLSAENQQQLTNVQGQASAGSNALQGILGGGLLGSITNPAGSGGPAPMSNLGQAIYNQLTQGVDQRRTRDLEQERQTLANRGIGIGNTAYSNTMSDFNTRYDDIYSNAASQAVTGEMNAQSALLTPLAQIGSSGFMAPNFQPFQSVNYNQPDAQGLFNTLVGGALTREGYQNELEMQKNQLGAQKSLLGGGGGGGGGGRSAPTGYQGRNPFTGSAPPGSS